MLNFDQRNLTGENLLQKIASDKYAAEEGINDMTRITLRENGLHRRILPFKPITVAELHPSLEHDMPSRIEYREIQQPTATRVPFGTLSTKHEMSLAKFRVDFNRYMTPSFNKDQAQLATYGPDVKRIFKEAMLLDLENSEDIPFFNAIDTITGNTGNVASTLTGKVQYHDYTSTSTNPAGLVGFTRETIIESFKVLGRSYTGNYPGASPIRAPLDLIVMNQNTALEYAKFDRNEAGGDVSQDMFKNGLTECNFFGRKHLVTMKDELIADGIAYHFAPAAFLGKAYEFEAPTVFTEVRGPFFEFFAWECVGSTISNPYGVARHKFF